MTTKTWKTTERRIAKVLGGRRVGCTGEATPDVIADWLVVEVKHRKRLPSWLKDALQQARQHAGERRLGIAVLHEHGRHDSLVVVSLADFRDWLGAGALRYGSDYAEARVRRLTAAGPVSVIGRDFVK